MKDKKTLKKDCWSLAVVLIVYSINRFFVKKALDGRSGIVALVLKNHFNDFLGPMVLICYINIVITLVLGSEKRIVDLIPVIVVASICSLFWEGIFPRIFRFGTPDYYDCVAYYLGGVIYWLIYLRNTKAKTDSVKNKTTESRL